jgi:hypothetical protein
MEFFIDDPNIIRYPPSETRLIDLSAHPEADGKLLRVKFELLPFQQRPDIEISLINAEGNEMATASIIEPVAWKMEITLHIRKAELTAGKYTLMAGLFYPDLGEVDRRTITLEIPHPSL